MKLICADIIIQTLSMQKLDIYAKDTETLDT